MNGLSRQGIFLNSLGYTVNIPNIILFQGEFDKNFRYTTVVEKLIDVIKDRRVVYNNVLYDGNGWYIAEFRRDDWITELHTYLLKLIKNDVIIKHDENNLDFQYMTKEEQNSYNKYNYRYAGKPYIPYLILGRTDNKYNYRLMNFISNRMIKIPKRVEICKVIAYEIGENNICKRILYELEL